MTDRARDELEVAARQAPLAALFAPPRRPGELRLGWEYRARTQVAPFVGPRPVPSIPPPTWVQAVEPAMARAHRRRRAYALCGTVLAVPSLLLLIAVQGSAQLPFLGFLAGALLLVGRGLLLPARARDRVQAPHAAWLEASIAAHERYRHEYRRWTAARREHQEREGQRLEQEQEWGILSLRDVTGRVDGFGGTPAGWESLITTVGSAALGAGQEVVVVDLSEAAVATELIQLATLQGVPSDLVVLPEQLEEVHLLDRLGPAEVADVLLEAFHGGAQQVSDEVRGTDARLLGAVCEALEPPYTIERIAAGLRVLLDQEDRPRDDDGPLSADEFDRIADLFGGPFRQAVQQRLVALESGLHDLGHAGRQELRRPLSSGQARLRVVALGERAPTLVADRLAHLLPQLLIRAARDATEPVPGQRLLLIAGADRIRRRHLERLEELSQLRRVRLVYLFRHLREDAEDLLGSAGAALFMRLGNTTEARNAADFIGREHVFALHEVTAMLGETRTADQHDTSGGATGSNRERGYSRMLGLLAHGGLRGASPGGSFSRQWGRSVGWSQGDSRTTTTGYQRTYDLTVEPRTLQTLPETAFLLVDLRTRRREQLVRLGDCNPDVLNLPRVSPDPLPER